MTSFEVVQVGEKSGLLQKMASACKKFASPHKDTMSTKITINGDNCTSNNCKYRYKYCDDCYCKNCENIRKSKGIKQKHKPHALTCCCIIIFVLLTTCVWSNTSAQMTYVAQCTLYDIKTMNCCLTKYCVGKRDVYKFMADCNECAKIYGINATRDGLSLARTVKPDTNSIFVDKFTECYPSQNALEDAKKNYRNRLFDVKINATVDCTVAKYQVILYP